MYIVIDASKMRRAMLLQLGDLKSCLEATDYPPLVQSKMEIEKLQERIVLLNAQLNTQKDHKEKIMKEINGTDCT